MTAETIGVLVDAGIPLLGGIYATLLGFRVIGKPKGEAPEVDAWHQRYASHLKILGPMVMIFGLVKLMTGLAR
jgi:hypothetical protein